LSIFDKAVARPIKFLSKYFFSESYNYPDTITVSTIKSGEASQEARSFLKAK
jgi:hypothetical protein